MQKTNNTIFPFSTMTLGVPRTQHEEEDPERSFFILEKIQRRSFHNNGKDLDGFSTGLKLFSEVSGQHIRE